MREEFQKKSFRSEEDEANWWDQHQDALAVEFQQAAADGTLGHGTLRRVSLPTATTSRTHLSPLNLVKSLVMAVVLNLDSKTQARLDRVAEARHSSPEGIAGEVIKQYLERNESSKQAAEGRHPSGQIWPGRSPVGGIITPV